jgi:hypothetical protein
VKKKRSASEGAVFLVPLPATGFGVGVLIRTSGTGRAYGAFFGPRVVSESEVDVSRLRDEDAILRCRFGDHGLHTQRWTIIGSISDWGAHRWELPRFKRGHDDPSLRYVTTYDDSLRAIAETLQPVNEAAALPDDGQFGSGLVEAKLSKILL